MKLKLLPLATLLFFSVFLFGQDSKTIEINYPDNVNAPLSKNERAMIDEVYKDQADSKVYNNATFLKDIKHLLRNRILIYKDENPKTQKGMQLSQVPLFDTYNKNLKRDVDFKVDNFNPLKYQLDFFSKGTYVYKVDNTNYFIQVTSQYRKL